MRGHWSQTFSLTFTRIVIHQFKRLCRLQLQFVLIIMKRKLIEIILTERRVKAVKMKDRRMLKSQLLRLLWKRYPEMSSTLQKTLSILVWLIFNVNADKVILTNSGLVKGVTVSERDLTIEAFLGIPFAEPPVGELRFRNPLPKTPWQDVYKAVSLPPSCMQNNSGHYYEPSPDTPMSEDCLYLNLWVPYQRDVTEPTPLKTIMIFFHGGAFNIGSSNQKLYDGTNLAKKGDVIVATFNYRLGAFGFIFPNIEDSDTNMGTFDQILAMKWIKENGRAFGGDPDRIVLFGESAGSMSIGAHLYSHLTRDLFKRAIMQSGSSTIPFTLLNNTGLFQISQRLALFAGCADEKRSLKNDSRGVMACLQNLPAETIAKAEGQLRNILPVTFYPSTGGEYSEVAPVEYLKRGDFKDTELLIGHNEAEGPFFLAVGGSHYFGEDGSNKIRISSKRFARNLVRTALNMVGIGGKEAKEVAKNYTDPIESGNQDAFLDAVGNSIGDFLVTCGTYFHAELTSLKSSPVYYYVLKRRASSSPLGEWMKTTHFDELQYVFGNPLFDEFTPEEAVFSDKVMRRWLAFAKTGNPNIPGEVEWPKFHLSDQKYLEMSDVDVVRSERPDEGRCEAWRAQHQAFIDDDVLKNFKGH